MSGINLNNSSNISSLFGSLSSNRTSDSLLSDYASLKNGSYKKLMKAYYKEMGSSTSDSESTKKTNSSTSKQTAADKKSIAIKDAVSTLAESADALTNSSLYAKKTITTKDENGNEVETLDYDRDAIYDAVSAFVTNYNKAVSTAADNGSDRVLRQTINMQSATTTNAKMLAKIGITIGKDKTLSVDKETLNKADVATIQSIFGNGGSYGSTISSKASLIYSSASHQASTKSSYSSNGSYLDKILNGNIYSTKA